MTNADKMFEELGYKKEEYENDSYRLLRYKKDDDNIIYFDKDQEIHKEGEYAESYYGVTIPELKAINEKVKELGWYD